MERLPGSEQVAVFGFPIELLLESVGVPTSARPPLTLFLSVMSIDRWERHRHLGYAHFSPRAESIGHVVDVSSWRVAESRENALHSFFVSARPPSIRGVTRPNRGGSRARTVGSRALTMGVTCPNRGVARSNRGGSRAQTVGSRALAVGVTPCNRGVTRSYRGVPRS